MILWTKLILSEDGSLDLSSYLPLIHQKMRSINFWMMLFWGPKGQLWKILLLYQLKVKRKVIGWLQVQGQIPGFYIFKWILNSVENIFFPFFDFAVAATPWFEAFRDCFIQMVKPSDHEFIRHFVGCILLSPVNLLNTPLCSLNLAGIKCWSVPQWTEPAIFGTFSLEFRKMQIWSLNGV